MRLLKWLYPGMRIKRWIFLAGAGVILFGMGSALLTAQASMLIRAASLLILGTGLFCVIAGVVGTVRSLLDVVLPSSQNSQRDLVDIVFQRRHLDKGPRIVAVGGGTGLSALLQGLKSYTANLTAIVTVADDGGSSGRLREEFGMLPPGDIRNCLVALADAGPLMQQLFQYRFSENSALQGHSFGNLFLTAMTKITGDFERAIQASSRVLAIRGRVVPSTCERVRLIAEHDDGSMTIGESKISGAERPVRRLYLEPASPKPTKEALSAIREADAIVLGPGSLYTSIIPNLLVDGMVEAIVESKALKVYVCNVMTQFRETDRFAASDHVRALIRHTNPGIIQVCVINTKKVPSDLLERYETEQAFPVEADIAKLRSLGYQVVSGDVINAENYVRHDSDKLARLIINLTIGSRRSPAANGAPRKAAGEAGVAADTAAADPAATGGRRA